MCHLLLLMPLLAVPIFWIAPLTVALTVYIPILAMSLWLYWFAMKTMRRPVETGREQLLQSTGEVIDAADGSLRVRVRGEAWQAVSTDELHRDDTIEVTGMTGLKLHVRKIARDPHANDGPRTEAR
jgi:inner membrane protein